MKYYAIRYDSTGINLHVFGTRRHRDVWCDRVNKPMGQFGARKKVLSRHSLVRDFYDEEASYYDHRTDSPRPKFVK